MLDQALIKLSTMNVVHRDYSAMSVCRLQDAKWSIQGRYVPNAED